MADGGVVIAAGIPRSIGAVSDPWITGWTGESARTVRWQGITHVEPMDGASVWVKVGGKLAVSSSVSGLSTSAEVLLKADYQPSTGETLAVLWRVPHGKGASYFYTGSFAVDTASWMQGASVLAEIFHALEVSGEVDWFVGEDEARAASTTSGALRLLGGDVPLISAVKGGQ